MNFTNCPVTLILIAANVIFSMIGFSNRDMLNKFIGWPYYEKKNNQYYRFVSSGFLHADWAHLIFNMIALFLFGSILEPLFSYGLGGAPAYLALYFFGMIMGDIPGFLKHREDEYYRSLGASGAVSAVVFACIVFMPWNTFSLYGFIRLSGVVFAILYIVYCVYMGKRKMDNIGHDAHLWGSIFGLAFMLALVAIMRSDLFPYILEDLQHPTLTGRREPGLALQYLMNGAPL